MKRKTVYLVVAVALVVGLVVGTLLGGSTLAQQDAPGSVPDVINYQGYLTDSGGNPVADGDYEFLLSIYDVETGGTALWSETQTVATEDGLFSVLLGSVNPLDAADFDGSPRYLGIKVGTDDEMTPRQVLASVPYALQAENAQALEGEPASSFLKITGGNVTGPLTVNGYVESTSGGFKFPDGTTQATAAGDPRQLIQEFVVASGETVTAGDVVGFFEGYVQTGIPGFGSEYMFNSAITNDFSVAALSSTRFVVAYRDMDDLYGTAVIGDVSGSTITYGPEYVFNSAMTYSSSVAALSSARFVVAYADGGNSWHGTAVIGDVSGSSITYGSEYVFNSAGTYYLSVAALSSTRFVATYADGDNSGYGTAVIGDVSGSTIAYGSEYVFNSGSLYDISVADLSSTRFVVAYQDVGNSGYGTAVIGDVSGSSITYGSEYVFNSAGTGYVSVAALSSTRFVATYRDGGNLNYGTAVIGDVSGSSITYGPEDVFNSAGTDYISVAALSSTRFVATYADDGNSDYGTAFIGDLAAYSRFIGTARQSKAAGESVPVVIGGVSDMHSGLTPGALYYANASGSLTTDVTAYRVGLAISSTEILLDIDREHWW